MGGLYAGSGAREEDEGRWVSGRSLAELGSGSSLALGEGGGAAEGHDWGAEELGGQLRLVFVPGESLQLVIDLGVLKVVSSLFVTDTHWSGDSALSLE